jgi:AcrR family transcriptional regulator
MTVSADRPLRADAARNADRILRAAREIYAEAGPDVHDVHIESIARSAGVGERTLYRRFPHKADLLRAALDQSIAENLTPAIERSSADEDPLRGLADLMEAALSLGAQEHNLLAAARRAGALANISTTLDVALSDLMGRAQEAGQIRADLVDDDLPRIIAMLNSVLWSLDPAGGGWRRYVALILDGMTSAGGRHLPPAPALRYSSPEVDWPL